MMQHATIPLGNNLPPYLGCVDDHNLGLAGCRHRLRHHISQRHRILAKKHGIDSKKKYNDLEAKARRQQQQQQQPTTQKTKHKHHPTPPPPPLARASYLGHVPEAKYGHHKDKRNPNPQRHKGGKEGDALRIVERLTKQGGREGKQQKK